MKNCDREAFTQTNRLMLIGLLKISLSTQKESQKFVLSALFFLFSFGLFLSKVQAQIVPDNTLPVNSQVTPSDNVRFIDGGTRAGNNLFHSFQEFSVPTGTEAYFRNALDVQNIFSRVTGKSISNIDGLIRANGTANLFLLNPNGIIFGPNARLNIGGSFLGSTANSIKFGDGIEFSATNPQATPLLSVNVPIGLQYGKNAGEIRIQGKGQQSSFGATESFSSELNPLEVLPGKSLTFVGGNVIVEGGILQAPGGRVELGGLAGEGTVGINADGSLSFPNNSEIPVTLANVTINNKAGINVLGDGGGSITINANNLDISGNSLLSGGIATSSTTVANTRGDITFNAAQGITISSSRVENNVNPAVQVTDFLQSVNNGDINIKTGFLFVNEYGLLSTTTFGRGDAGNVKVSASSLVSFDGGAGAFSTVGIGALGNAGEIEISAKSVSVANGAQLSATTFGQGDAGIIKIFATDQVSIDGESGLFSNVGTNAVGNAGGIGITTKSLFVTNGAQVGTSTFGQGNAGIVVIEASDRVSFDGVSSNGQVSGAFSNVEKGAIGNALGIGITTGSLFVTNGAGLTASTFGKGNAGIVLISATGTVSFDGVASNGQSSGAFSAVVAGAKGDAGGIGISTKSLFVSNGAVLNASTSGNGNAGNVDISASDTVIFDGAIVFSKVGENAIGKGGSIEIDTKSLLVTGSSQLQAQTNGIGDAGKIVIRASDTVTFDQSNAFSSVEPQGVGNAGIISIETGSLFLRNGATLQTVIRSPAEGEQAPKGDRNAGIIIIQAKDLVSIEGSGTGIFSTVEKGASNNSKNIFAGNIFKDFVGTGDIVAAIGISTGSLELKDGARLSSSSLGTGNAGAVVVVAEDSVTIANNSRIFSSVTEDAIGDAGAILISGKSVSLTSDAQLITSSSAQGDAGIVVVLSTEDISLKNSSISSALLEGATGYAGGIGLDAGKSIYLTDGSELNAYTSGTGDAGLVILRAKNAIFLDNSNIFNTVEEKGTGNAGEIQIFGRSLSLTNGSQIQTLIDSKEPVTDGQRSAGNIVIQVSKYVSLSGFSIGTDRMGNQGLLYSLVASTVEENAIGNAGDINISARSLWLSKGTSITAETQAGEGGSINLNTTNLLVMRSGQITTTANESGGGGNIIINTDGLVAIKNSDITANAGSGSGGVINIDALSGSLGIQPLTREELVAQLGRDLTTAEIPFATQAIPSNDVTAISANPLLQGTVTFNTAVFQVIPLNQQLALPPLVPQACGSKIADGSEFIITGRGGLPINPIEAIADEAIWIDLRVTTEPSTKSAGRTEAQSKVSPLSTPSEIIEAQGWKINSQGEVVLVADTSTATPQNPNFFLPQECQQQ